MPDGEVQKTEEEIKQEQLQKLAELKAAYVETFATEQGKVVLADMKRRMWFNRPTIHDNSNQMAFREGQRSALCHIETMVNLDLGRIETLQKG